VARSNPASSPSRLLIVAAVCIVIAALYLAKEILIPLALAVLLSFLLAPLVNRLERWGLKRGISVLLVVVAALAVVVVLGYAINTQLVNLATNVDQYRDNISRKMESLHPHNSVFTKLFHAAHEVEQIATTQAAKAAAQAATQTAETHAGTTATGAPASPSALETQQRPIPVTIESPASPFGTLGRYVAYILSPAGTALMVLVFVIFILLQREDLRDRVIRLVGFGQLNVTTQAIDDAAFRISHYLGMLSIVNSALAVCVSVGLYLLGIPNAMLWGMLCGALRFIPYVGVWTGAAFPLLLSLAVFPDNWHFLATAGLFLVVETGVSQFLEPFLYGASTGMTPIAVLFAAAFWAWLWGPIGLLVSTPLTVLLVVVGKYIPQLQFFNVLLGDEPVLSPELRYYQRLLAMDSEEAEDLLEEYAKQWKLAEVYDRVVLPALALFKSDLHANQIEEAKRDFILQAVGEHIEQLGQQYLAPTASAAPAQGAPVSASPASEGRVDKAGVLILPAADAIDSLAARVTAQILQSRGHLVQTPAGPALVSELVGMVTAGERPSLVCVSAVPPGAVLHSRYLVKRLQGHWRDMPIVIAVYDAKGDARRMQERIAGPNGAEVATSLEQLLGKVPTASPSGASQKAVGSEGRAARAAVA